MMNNHMTKNKDHYLIDLLIDHPNSFLHILLRRKGRQLHRKCMKDAIHCMSNK